MITISLVLLLLESLLLLSRTARTCLIKPSEGVTPPSMRLEHSSMRPAPAFAAARAPCTLSTQISRVLTPSDIVGQQTPIA
jgi:hypothetical protein